MIEHYQKDKQQLTPLQCGQNEQQYENDVFESVSGESDVDEHEQLTETLIHGNQHFTLTPLAFPQPDKHTMHLIQLYQQNINLIKQLKQQISHLSQIKKGNLFIKYDSVKMNFYQQQSQFFLTSQLLYNQRQQQLQKIKREIRGVDRQQLTTIMSKDQHIFNLAEGYFERFRTVVEGEIYGEGLVVLTEEKRRVYRRRRHYVEEELVVERLGKSSSNSCSRIKKHNNNNNNCQQKTISNVVGEQRPIMRNESQRSDNDSNSNSTNKIPLPKRPLHQKTKRQFNIRFLHLSHLLPEFTSHQASHLTTTTCFTLGERTQSIPRSFAYDFNKKLILILYSTNSILGYYYLTQGSQEQIKHNDDDDHSSSHYNEHYHHYHNSRLREIAEVKIEIDINCKVRFFSLREQQLYLLTSDGVLRVYHIIYNTVKKQLTYEITMVIYCLNISSDQQLGEVQHVAFNKLNKDEILFTTTTNKLCRVDLVRYKTEIVRKFHQRIVYMNSDCIETDDSMCVNYYNQSERQYIHKGEMSEMFFKKDSKDLLKICTLLKGDQIHFVRINKHGLLVGWSKDLQL